MLPFSRLIYDQLLYFEWGSRYYGAGKRGRGTNGEEGKPERALGRKRRLSER